MNDYAMVNATMQTKPFYLRDADKFEEELDTSLQNLEDDSTTPEEEKPKPSAEDHDWKKRYSDLKSHLDKTVNAIKSENQNLVQQVTELTGKLKEVESKPKQYPVTDAELEEWVSEFPDFEKVLSTILSKRVDAEATKLRNEIEDLRKAQNAYAAEKGWAELKKLHPDAEELRNDPAFHAWYGEQEIEIQNLINSTDVKKIAKGITIYKKDTGVVTKTDQELKKDNSRAVTTGTSTPDTPKDKKIWSEAEIRRMSLAQFEKHAAEIQAAQREGRIKP